MHDMPERYVHLLCLVVFSTHGAMYSNPFEGNIDALKDAGI